MLPDAKCIDCKKYKGCLRCEEHKDKIPTEIIAGKKDCKEFKK